MIRDSWSWVDDLRNIHLSTRTKGIILIVVPLVILFCVGIYWYIDTMIFSYAKSAIIDVTITNPPPGFFDSTAQILTGIGLCIASICWGVSKVVKSVKESKA